MDKEKKRRRKLRKLLGKALRKEVKLSVKRILKALPSDTLLRLRTKRRLDGFDGS